MNNKIKELLNDAIEAEILGIGPLPVASAEKGAAIDDLVKLYKLRIEETKNEMDFSEKREARIMDIDEKKAARFMDYESHGRDKQEELSEKVKDRYFDTGLAMAEIILPLIFYATWMKRGFKFEETGTFTSATFKGLTNRFKPTKK